jgi:hypothetical protein
MEEEPREMPVHQCQYLMQEVDQEVEHSEWAPSSVLGPIQVEDRWTEAVRVEVHIAEGSGGENLAEVRIQALWIIWCYVSSR